MSAFLPDPVWENAGPTCLRCGYSMAGTAPPAPCPECGTLHEAQHLVIFGVPRGTGEAKNGRGWIIAAAIVLLIATFQLGPVVAMEFGWHSAALAGLLGFAILGYLLWTGSNTRGGTTKFVFTGAGIASLPLKLKKGAEPVIHFEPWLGDEVVSLEKVSNVWYRCVAQSNSRKSILFDAGIRCPESRRNEVFESLQKLVFRDAETRHPLPMTTNSNSNTPTPPRATPPTEAPPRVPS